MLNALLGEDRLRSVINHYGALICTFHGEGLVLKHKLVKVAEEPSARRLDGCSVLFYVKRGLLVAR